MSDYYVKSKPFFLVKKKKSHFVLISSVLSYHFLLQRNGQNKPVSTVRLNNPKCGSCQLRLVKLIL